MKENLHEQLSALVDNELEEQEQAMLFKQLAGDVELSGRLSRYQLISDTMQNHLPEKLGSGFHERIQAALRDEPPVRSGSSVLATWLKPVAGLAIAASVATVAVFSLQSSRNAGQESVPAVASAPSQDNYIRSASNDAVKSPEPAEVTQNLEIYLVNHSEYALSRGILPYVRLVGHDMNVNSRK